MPKKTGKLCRKGYTMSSDLSIFCMQRVRGFKLVNSKYSFRDRRCILTLDIERKKHKCPVCGCEEVTVDKIRQRTVRGLPGGACDVEIRFWSTRVYCPSCKGRWKNEPIPFLSNAHARITKTFEKFLMGLRLAKISILDLSKIFNVPWHTILGIELRYLEENYPKTPRWVSCIGVDEIYIQRSSKHHKFITVVRDLDSGDVLFVGDGKGQDGLFGAEKVLGKYNIKTVCMDMSNAYQAWFSEHLPNARIAFDHFHLVKLANNIVDQERRYALNGMDIDERKVLKNTRYTFLANKEDLKPEALERLEALSTRFESLGEAYRLKESLRNIYFTAKTEADARVDFIKWCDMASISKVSALKRLSKTIRSKMESILTYWTGDHLTNASMEGFNNKIRTLVKSAYGIRSRRYLKYKIYQLPDLVPVSWSLMGGL